MFVLSGFFFFLFSDLWFSLVLSCVLSCLQDELAIVAFPCNQFGAQEPGTWEEIVSFADRQYGVTFPIMGKVGTGSDSVYDRMGRDEPWCLLVLTHIYVCWIEEEKEGRGFCYVYLALLALKVRSIEDAMQQDRMGSGVLRPQKRRRKAELGRGGRDVGRDRLS